MFHHARFLPVPALAALVACAAPAAHEPAMRPGGDAPRPTSAPARPPAAAPPTTSSDLDAHVAFALQNHPRIAVARERWTAMKERVAQATAWPDPVFQLRVFAEEVQTRVGPQEWAVGLSQTIPWGSKTDALGNAAELAAAVEHARTFAAAADVVVSVRETWCELFYLERAIEIVRENHTLLRRLKEVVRTRYASGEATHADYIRSQVEVDRSADRLAGLTDRRRPLAARWRAALHVDDDVQAPRPERLDAEAPELTDDALRAAALATNPELGILRLELAAAEGNIELASVSERPNVTVGIEYIATGESGTSGSGADPIVLSLGMPIPLRKTRERARERETRALHRAVSQAIESKEDELMRALADEQYRRRDAQRRVELYTDGLLPKATEALQSTETAYRAGTTGFLDLVDAERALFELQLTLARADADRAIAAARIERIVGVPALNATEAGASR